MRILAAAVVAVVLYPGYLFAQETPRQADSPIFSLAALARVVRFDVDRTDGHIRTTPDGRRACDGCPVRRIWRPYLESLALNVMYNGINQLRGHPTARVGFNSWAANLKHGFEWDSNAWITNQVGHPVQGSQYFALGRANGLTFWESSALAAFGSGMWEYFYESNRASLNDLVNTTLGGIALGEVLHRVAWLKRDPKREHGPAMKREIIAAIIDPMSGLERVLSGDRNRIVQKPAYLVPDSVTWRWAGGTLWQDSRDAGIFARPFVEWEFFYGDARRGDNKLPFEAFTLNLAAGVFFVESGIRGQLFGRSFGRARAGQLSVVQTFDFLRTKPYSFGGQGFEVEVGVTQRLGARRSVWMAATGGATILAAADSVLPPPDGVNVPALPNRRWYDYGPGARVGALGEITRDGQLVFRLSYQAYQVSVVDGTRAVHVLQRMHADARLPITSQLSIGVSADYFFRKAYFWNAGDRVDQTPQVRVFAAWRAKPVMAKPVMTTRAPVSTAPPSLRKSFAGQRLWFVAGTGVSVARGGCAACDRAGVFTNSRSFLVNAGVKVTSTFDAGLEIFAVSLKLINSGPFRTTFVLGAGQVRPWEKRGLFLRAGLGIGIAGNGLSNSIGPQVDPPSSTNSLALTYGVGWLFRPDRRWTVQVYASQYAVALGELTTASGTTIKNVVGNYWTIGMAFVIR